MNNSDSEIRWFLSKTEKYNLPLSDIFKKKESKRSESRAF